MTKQFTSDLKLKAVHYYHKINNYVKVCEIFECSERSLKRWVERYDKNKNVDRKTRKLGSYKLEQQHIHFIKDTLRKHSDIQMNFLQELLKRKFPKLDISRQYLSDIIRDNNITRKRATFKHFPKTYRGNIRNEKEELKEFFDVINQFKLEDIISIDETAIYVNMVREHGRNDKGRRAYYNTGLYPYKKYNCLCAIKYGKVVGVKIYEETGGINKEKFMNSIILKQFVFIRIKYFHRTN
jgi:transposase